MIRREHINGHTARILADNRATDNFISRQWMQEKPLESSPMKESVKFELADGKTSQKMNQAIQARVCIEAFKLIRQLPEIKLGKYDAMLGLGWLEPNNLAINWNNRKM